MSIAAESKFEPPPPMTLSTELHEIETDMLRMRAIQLADLPLYVDLFANEENMKHVGLRAGQTLHPSEVEGLVSGAVMAWTTRGYARWSLFTRHRREFVGYCGFREENGNPELITMIDSRFSNVGLGTQSAAACLKYGFEKLGFEEVLAYTRPENESAVQLLEKLGAEFLGHADFHGVRSVSYRFTAPPKVQ
jgi:[ribosomal protein S5]-alanine N-acetyltransferase